MKKGYILVQLSQAMLLKIPPPPPPPPQALAYLTTKWQSVVGLYTLGNTPAKTRLPTTRAALSREDIVSEEVANIPCHRLLLLFLSSL